MVDHQFFSYGYNLFIFGGYKYDKGTTHVWVFHTIEREYWKINALQEARYSHTLHYKDEHAYIIGGYTGKMKVMRQCLYFNAIN